ncbi:MAG: iron-containing alcohol dehydrogenase family protein [Solirubrobacterales bacterium]
MGTAMVSGPEWIAPFSNHLPVRIDFGREIAVSLPEAADRLAAKRSFVVLDAGLREMVPAVRAAVEALEARGSEVELFEKEAGEPTVAGVEVARDALVEAAPDSIIAIGGGSVMDTAKVARLCSQLDSEVLEMFRQRPAIPAPKTPLICAPTTAGTGSEVSGGAVVSDPETGAKAGIAGPNLRAQEALVDPALTLSLPGTVTAHSGIDALAQAIAGIVARTRTPVGNAVAFEAIRLVAGALPVAVEDGGNLAAREAMACGSLMAGLTMNISDCAAEHSIAQAIGALTHLPHGLTIGLVLAETLERERVHVPALMERVGDAMGVPDNDSRDGSRAVRGVRELLACLEFPVLSDYEIADSDLDGLVELSLSDIFINQSPAPWTAEEVREVLVQALALPARSRDGGG